MTSEGVCLRSEELYRRRKKSRDSSATRRNNVRLNWNRMGRSCNRNTRGGNWNCGSCRNTTLGKVCYAIDRDATILARDIRVNIGTVGRVTSLGLEVLRLAHYEEFLDVVEERVLDIMRRVLVVVMHDLMKSADLCS